MPRFNPIEWIIKTDNQVVRNNSRFWMKQGFKVFPPSPREQWIVNTENEIMKNNSKTKAN